MSYLGDFPTSAVIYIPFATYDKDDGSSITMTGLAVTDIEIYKNGSATQRASDNGYTLLDTDGIDFDTITGLHGFSVDTSDNSDAGFYAAGNEYQVAVSAITVDGVTVNFWAATFSIERSGGALALLKHATYGLSAIETLVDDLETRCTEARLSELDAGTGGKMANQVDVIETDTTALDGRCTEARLAELDAANLPTDVAAVKTDTAAILLDTGTDGVMMKLINQDYIETGTAQSGNANSITLAAGAASTNDLWVAQQVSIYDGTGAGQTRGVLNYNGTTKVLTVARNWKVNPDATSKYKIQLWFGPKVNNTLEVTVADAGADLSAIPWNAAWDAEVQSECADALTAYGASTHSAADVWTVATRVLTAGTNIALAKGTGVTGFNDIAAADVWSVATRVLTGNVTVGAYATGQDPATLLLVTPANKLATDSSGFVTEVNVDGIKKNTALSNFEFLMVDLVNGYIETLGLTVTAQRSIDGAAFASCSNSVAEVGNGIYRINLTATDLNGDIITLRFSAAGARTRYVTLKTNT